MTWNEIQELPVVGSAFDLKDAEQGFCFLPCYWNISDQIYRQIANLTIADIERVEGLVDLKEEFMLYIYFHQTLDDLGLDIEADYIDIPLKHILEFLNVDLERFKDMVREMH